MSNNKQSSVEWLVEKLGKYNEEMIFLYQNEIQEAKAKHENESFETFKAGQESMEEGGKGFDQYYNEKFGGNK